MIFGSNSMAPNTELGSLLPYVKSSVKKNLMDSDFKFEKQINSVVKASFLSVKAFIQSP